MDDSAPFSLLLPRAQRAAVVLTSPHSGRRYEAAFLATARLDANAIRRSEDCFVDELFAGAPAVGLPLLSALFPRAYCDVNREAWELDPAMFADALPDYVNSASPRVQAGLGTIARIVGTGEAIYETKLRFAEAQARIEACWQPFHEALGGLIDDTLAGFGTCLVLDCHSMPSIGGRYAAKPDIVLGDGHGTSCHPALSQFVQARFADMGFAVRRNDPYAGGYITRHYGRPREGVQAIQVEVARGLYMNERNFTRGPQFAPMQALMTAFLTQLIAASPLWNLATPVSRQAAAE